MLITSPKSSHLQYHPHIDGLRAISVLSVVLFHAFPTWVKGGFIGVDIFFVVSGYLISSIIFESLNNNSFSFFNFYSRRIRRIIPALLIVLIACLTFGWFLLFADQYQQLGKHIFAGTAFISNFILWEEAGYFDNSAETKPLLHLWSLAIEEQFYFVWPLILWFLWKYKFNFLIIASFLCIASFSLNLKGVNQDIVATFYLPHTRFWELLSGSLLAWLVIYKKNLFLYISSRINTMISRAYIQMKKRDINIVENIISFLGFSLLIFGFFIINKELSYPGIYALIPTISTLLIIAAGSRAWINQSLLSNKFLIWFGLISFPLYLWHWPLLSFARIIEGDTPDRNIRITIVIISIILAWLTYKYIECPIRLGKFNKLKVLLLMFFLIVIGYLGYTIYKKNGFDFRSIQQSYDNSYPKVSRAYENNLINSFSNYYGSSISKKPLILVLGDSYATNWGVALSRTVNLENYDLAIVSYLGCNVNFETKGITAKPVSRQYLKNCTILEKFFNDSSLIGRVTSIMLASHRPFEYSANPFRFDLIRFLLRKNPDIKIIVFGNYFQLDSRKSPTCDKLMVKTKTSADICIKEAGYPKSAQDIKLGAFFPLDIKFLYVDIINLLCFDDISSCPSSYNGVPFMLDWDHLTATFLTHNLPNVFKKNDMLSGYLKQSENSLK